MKIVPTGIEDFKKLIDNDYYYVDKTTFIKDVCKEKVALYTRPQGFGKTLNMSMLYYFFSINQKENNYLFHGLNIMEDEEAMIYQNQYPVIHITLKDLKNNTFKKQLSAFSTIISNIILDHKEVMRSETTSLLTRKWLVLYLNRNKDEINLRLSLNFIISCLHQHYQKKVILLIDDYDIPLQYAYLNGYYDKMVDFLRNVFSAALKTNKNLEKCILTGSLQIAKRTLFAGLRKFNIYSIFQNQSSTCFGFTTQEVNKMLNSYQMQSYETIVKEWYAGYLFGQSEVYNLGSVLNFIKYKTHETLFLRSFWTNINGNDIIKQYLSKTTPQIRKEFDILILGGTLDKTIKSDLTYRRINNLDNIYSFLLFTGYLKVVKQIHLDVYRLKIPNKEVHKIYKTMFKEWINVQLGYNREIFVDALIKENVDKAKEILNQILFQSVSYYDYDEQFYHGFLVGLLCDYQICSNQESGVGRYDIVVLPVFKEKRGLLFELKISKTEEKMQEMSEKACQQILAKKYIEGL